MPIVPCVCIFFNIFLFAQVQTPTFVFNVFLALIIYDLNSELVLLLQLHYEAWIRFVVVSVLATAVYALYGQYHADANTLIYQRAPESEDSG